MSIRQALFATAMIGLSIATVISFITPGPPQLRMALTNELFVTPEGHVAERLVYGDFYLSNGKLLEESVLWRWRAQTLLVSGIWLAVAIALARKHGPARMVIAVLIWAFGLLYLLTVTDL